MDPGCAPKWVFPTHPPDQIAQATINPRPPCPIARFPTPKHFETSAMPTQDGVCTENLNPDVVVMKSAGLTQLRDLGARSDPRKK